MNSSDATNHQPLVTVVAVNYNCKSWLDRFFQSLRAQTIFDRVEVIIVDNASSDGSAEICEGEMASWPSGVFLQTGGNYGFGGGSNRGVKIARGKYLFSKSRCLAGTRLSATVGEGGRTKWLRSRRPGGSGL